MRCCILLLLLFGRSLPAAADEPPFDCRSAIKATVATLAKEHLQRRPLDDALSRRWLEGFLASLDPSRMYFLSADWKEFAAYGDRLDDLAQTGDFGFPTLARARYRERVAVAAALAEEFLTAEHDFSVDEQGRRDYDAAAADGAALRERWRLRIKLELLIEKAHGRPLAEVQAQLRSRYQRIAGQAREMTDERLCEMYLIALLRSCDPHSEYWSPAHNAEYERGLFPVYTLRLQWHGERGRFRIRAIYPPLRSERTELLIGYELMAIKRNDGTLLDFVELHPADAFRTISSVIGPLKSDSQVVLELLHPVTLQRKSVRWNRLSY